MQSCYTNAKNLHSFFVLLHCVKAHNVWYNLFTKDTLDLIVNLLQESFPCTVYIFVTTMVLTACDTDVAFLRSRTFLPLQHFATW